MAIVYAVHRGYGDPEICETREDAEKISRWHIDHPYWGTQNGSGHALGEIEEIPAKLPNDAGIRTEYDIHDTDMGGYLMGYYPASIDHGHAELVGCGPLCADCARAFLRENADDETVTLFGEPEYESDFGEYCEDCGKELCAPHCQVCGDLREDDDTREWYQSDSYGYICPRCMADAVLRGRFGVDCRPRGTYRDYGTATRLAPGVYDMIMFEHDGMYNGRGLFYVPSCGHHVRDVWDAYHAAHTR